MNDMKIGDKEIVFLQTFIIPRNETLEFTFSPTHPDPTAIVAFNKATVNVRVRLSDSEGDSVNAEWGNESGRPFVMIRFPSTVGRLGPTMLTKPIKVGVFGGRNLGFLAAFSSSGVGELSLVTLQFMLGGGYE